MEKLSVIDPSAFILTTDGYKPIKMTKHGTLIREPITVTHYENEWVNIKTNSTSKIQLSLPVADQPIEINNSSYLLGIILTDAWYSTDNIVEIYQGAENNRVCSDINRILSLLNIKYTRRKRTVNHKEHYTWRINKKNSPLLKDAIGLTERHQPPYTILFDEGICKHSLMVGLMDGDGTWLSDTRGSFYKPGLALFFKTLIFMIGYRSIFHPIEGRVNFSLNNRKEEPLLSKQIMMDSYIQMNSEKEFIILNKDKIFLI